MKNGKFTIHRLNDVFVISDDGRIARMLGLGDTEWHLVAPNAELIGDRIDRMARLLDAAKESRALELIDSALDASVPCTTAADPPTSIQFHIPTKESQADGPIETMKISGHVATRLRNAGIKTLGQLVGYSADELLALRGVGETVLIAVEKGLRGMKKGYRLKQKVC